MNIITKIPLSAIFPDRQHESLNDLLEGIDRRTIFRICTHFASAYNAVPLDKIELRNFLLGEKKTGKSWFGPWSKPEGLLVFNEACKWIDNHGGKATLLNTESLLLLFEFALLRADVTLTKYRTGLELGLLLAILKLNEEIDKRDKTVWDSVSKLPKDCKLPSAIFCYEFPVFELSGFDSRVSFVNQLVKSLALLKFIRTKKPGLYLNFCKKYQVCDHKEFLRRLLPLIIPTVSQNNIGTATITVPKGNEFQKTCEFIKSFCLTPIEGEGSGFIDYRKLRSQPILKNEPGIYSVIYSKFLIEKLYYGIIWGDLRMIMNRNQFGSFLSTLRKEFVEEVLFYSTIERVLPTEGVHFTGDQIDQAGMTGGIDYYFRNEQGTLLLECKDISIPSEIKQSADFNQYFPEFKKKLYEKTDSRGRKKRVGVKQLAYNIQKILEGNFIPLSEAEASDWIYPILVLGEGQFDSKAFNFLLNFWHQREMGHLEEQGFDIEKVRPLLVFSLDILILFQDFFSSGVNFIQVIEDYFSFVYSPPQGNREDWLMKRYISFGEWLKISKGDYEQEYGVQFKMVPDVVVQEGLELFN